MSQKKRIPAACVALAVSLAACSGSGTSPKGVTQANVAANVLQLAVGSANIFGDVPGNAVTGLNVVPTYRQPVGGLSVGSSAVLVSSPTLSGPFTLPAVPGTADGFDATVVTGPAPGETTALTSTPQTAATTTSFGVSGGVFGMGIEPFNLNQLGSPDTITPYQVPLFDSLSGTTAGDPNAFIPWGGPPAFIPAPGQTTSIVGNSNFAGGAGVPEGLDVFEMAPVAGTYSLAASVPGQTGNAVATATATATLTSTALLPAATAPTPTLDATGDGGATFAVVLPAGVTEAYVQITDIGPANPSTVATDPIMVACNGASPAKPVSYTIEVTASGTATLPPAIGPAGTPSLCTAAQNLAANTSGGAAPTGGNAPPTGDQFFTTLIGFDYPAFEAAYPQSNGNPTPVIKGANGQADITISSALLAVQPAAGGAPTLTTQSKGRSKALLKMIQEQQPRSVRRR